MVSQEILGAIIEQLTISYTIALRVVPKENIAIVSGVIADALDFDNVDEVRATFKKARMSNDIPTQRTLAEGLRNLRAERIPTAPMIEYDDSKKPIGQRIPTQKQRQYLFAHAALTYPFNFVPYETAKKIVDEFEADPKNKEYVNYVKGKRG